MSSEQNHSSTRAFAPHSILQLALSPGERNANSGPCPRASSPDSQRSLSDQGTSSPSDIDMEVYLSQSSPDDCPSHLDAISTFVLPQQVSVSGEVNVGASETSISSFMNNTSVDNWNGNISLVISNVQNSPRDTRENEEVRGDRSMAPSPNSVGGEHLRGSTAVLRRASSKNVSSLSSEEMVMRNNSFCLQDDQALVISHLEEYSGSPALAPCSPALPTELSSMSATVPDGCEGLLEGEKIMPAQHCWGMTFILPEDHKLPPEDDPVVQSTSRGDIPLERNENHLRTFLCEPASTAHDGVSLATVPCSKTASDAELWLYFTGDSTPGKGQPILFPANEDPDSSDHVQTSTPVQNVGNKTISFPILNESPFTTSPTPHLGLRAAVTPKRRLVARLPPSTGRISKAEIKSFRKPDFSCIKPKIITRPPSQPSMASFALAKVTSCIPAQVTLPSKLSQGNKSIPIMSPPVGAVKNIYPKSDGDSQFSKHLGAIGQSFGAPYLGMMFIQSDDQDLSPAEDGECKGSVSDSLLPVYEQVPVVSPPGPETGHVSSRSGQPSSGPCPGNQTFCIPYLAESSSSKDQGEPTQAPANERKEEVPNHNKRTIVTSNLEKLSTTALHSRCLSESSSVSQVIRETRGSTSSSSSSRTKNPCGQANPGLQNRHHRQLEARKATPERPSLEFKKVGQKALSKKPVTGEGEGGGEACKGSRSQLAVRPSPVRIRGSLLASPSPRPAPLAPRPKQGAWGKDGSSNSRGIGILRTKRITSSCAGSQMACLTEGPPGCSTFIGATSTKGGTKPPVSRSRLLQTPGLGSTPVSRQPHKPQAHGANRSQPSKTSEHSFGIANKQASEGHGQSSAGRLGSSTTPMLRARQLANRGKGTGAALAAVCKTTALTNHQTASPLKRTASSRVVNPTGSLPVDKIRPKANPQNQPPVPVPPAPSHGHPDMVLMAGRMKSPMESYQAQCEKQKQLLQQLRGLLANSDCRFQAVVVVLQQALTERDEVMKQRRELSQEMMTLKGELVSSAHTCDRLKQEKEDALSTMEEVLLKVQEQHCRELAQLEERLQIFYQAEWDKVHFTYQQEADKCKALMEQQMGELRATHDDLRLVLEHRHSEQLQTIQKQYEDSVKEMRKTHERELQTLERTLKEAEATMSGQIQELTAENSTLSQKLKAEENRRRELADKNQKDSHTLYLEQELESLKVVLDIKIKQLHQQDKKLMQMDKLMEKSVKLDECLQKVQQENEDLRARMDRHTALSRQLSTEQAVLQESLQKESKVNKRLSMENEELLWKLHNGDLSSPRKMSPTSPAHALSLQSPRSSAIFSSPPLSPR